VSKDLYQQSFQQWYCEKFEWFVKQPMPYLIIYQGVLWVFYGFLWIPIWYFTTAKTIRVGHGEQTVEAAARQAAAHAPRIEWPSAADQSALDAVNLGGESIGTEVDLVSPAEVIDINKASPEEFATLPGFTLPLATKVVARRSKIGGFSSVEQLIQLLKVKPHLVSQLKAHMSCSPVAGSGRTVDI